MHYSIFRDSVMFSRQRVGACDGIRAGDDLNLANLPMGRSARIKAVHGSDAISGRLLEMGLTPGIVIRVLGTAFSGDPIEIEVRNYRLTLRRSEARRVVLESVEVESQ